MNERIKELITEAFDTAEYPADQKYRIEPNKVFCQKFAELIVQECLAQVDKVDAMLDDDKEKTGVAWVGLAIARHFGVEE